MRETILSPVAPQGFPGQTNLINFGFDGFPDPYHSSPALELLKSAVFFIDAANAKTGDAYAFNQGTGGFALDARYGSSLAIGAADTNDPLLLPWSGETYVYLPGSASNTIACTAPVGTASYAAYPTGGGSATTGAAVAGAFTLQTTGSWIRVDILDAGPTVIASFVAASSTSTGYTDTFGVAWTVNRATAGRKAVAVTRPVWLLGTDDYMEVPDNDLLDFGANQDYTVLAIVNTFGTPSTNEVFVGKGAYGNVGVSLVQNATTGNVAYQAGPPFAANFSYLTISSVTGLRLLAGGRSGSTAFGYADNTALSYVGGNVGGYQNLDVSDAYPLRIGANGGSTANAYANFELLAVAVFRRALTATEIASINTYFGTA